MADLNIAVSDGERNDGKKDSRSYSQNNQHGSKHADGAGEEARNGVAQRRVQRLRISAKAQLIGADKAAL